MNYISEIADTELDEVNGGANANWGSGDYTGGAWSNSSGAGAYQNFGSTSVAFGFINGRPYFSIL